MRNHQVYLSLVFIFLTGCGGGDSGNDAALDNADNQAPQVNAGEDITVSSAESVSIYGNAEDLDGTIDTLLWEQVAGPTVELYDSESATLTLVAPTVSETSQLLFRLTATDNLGKSTSDEVMLTVLETGEENTNPLLVSDFVPPSGKVIIEGETPADKRLILARSSDGVTYTKDDTPFSDQANVPDIIQLANGDLYLYYTGWTVGERENTSAVAISQDNGVNWVYKYINIAGTDFSSPGDPDVLLLDDGTIRMFFTGTINSQVPEIHYADSADGVNFTYRGKAYTHPEGGFAKDSLTFKLPDGTWGMYIFLDDYVFAKSVDGMNFSKVSDFSLTHNNMTYILDNEITHSDGSYTFYAFSFGNDTTPSHIAAFESEDGISFTFAGERLQFDAGNPLESKNIKNGTPFQLANGHYILAYTTVIE